MAPGGLDGERPGAVDAGCPGLGRGGATAEHRLHLLRRPRLPGDQRLRRPAEADRDAEHRPHREGGDAVRPLPRAELDLRAEPGHDPHRQVQPPQRLLQQHQQPLRRLADRRSPSCCRRRATRRRSSASGTSSPTRPASTTGTSSRARGVYYNPPMIQNGQRVKHQGYATDIITDLVARLAQEPRQVEAVPADVPAQGAAPRVGAGAAAPRARQRPQVPRAATRSSTTTPAAAWPCATRT